MLREEWGQLMQENIEPKKPELKPPDSNSELLGKLSFELRNDFAFATHNIAAMRKENRLVIKMLVGASTLLLVAIGAFAFWKLSFYPSPNIAKINYTGTKTLIELQNQGKVTAYTDDKTGVMTVEVKNATN
jgi:hypothetical protein